MNAHKFVKQYGWDLSLIFIENWSSLSVHYGFNIDDLKRLVESHELVQRMGGNIDEIKAHADHVESNLNAGVYFKCVEGKTRAKINAWRQAIADVGACQ